MLWRIKRARQQSEKSTCGEKREEILFSCVPSVEKTTSFLSCQYAKQITSLICRIKVINASTTLYYSQPRTIRAFLGNVFFSLFYERKLDENRVRFTAISIGRFKFCRVRFSRVQSMTVATLSLGRIRGRILGVR